MMGGRVGPCGRPSCPAVTIALCSYWERYIQMARRTPTRAHPSTSTPPASLRNRRCTVINEHTRRKNMSVFEIIKRRRSIGKMTPDRPSRQQIERLLEAATHAPNHHKVQPWKFIVLAGGAREELGALMAD